MVPLWWTYCLLILIINFALQVSAAFQIGYQKVSKLSWLSWQNCRDSLRLFLSLCDLLSSNFPDLICGDHDQEVTPGWSSNQATCQWATASTTYPTDTAHITCVHALVNGTNDCNVARGTCVSISPFDSWIYVLTRLVSYIKYILGLHFCLLIWYGCCPRSSGCSSSTWGKDQYTDSLLYLIRNMRDSLTSKYNEYITKTETRENRQEDRRFDSDIYTQKDVNQESTIINDCEDIANLFTTNENVKPEQIINSQIQGFIESGVVSNAS